MKVFNLNNFRKLRSGEEGNTIIEYAIVAPILFLMVFGILEFSMIMYAQSVIGNATTMASRFGMTGSDYKDESGVNTDGRGRVELLKKELVEASFGLLKKNSLSIETDTFSDYIDGAPAVPSGGCDFGQSGQGVMYRISYKWNIHTPIISGFFNGGAYNLKSNVLVLDEEFDGTVDSDCT